MPKSNAKPNCVACGDRLIDPETNYQVRGNFCPSCNTKSETAVKVKRRAKQAELAMETLRKKALADNITRSDDTSWWGS